MLSLNRMGSRFNTGSASSKYDHQHCWVTFKI